jgi:hypothetical protein
MKINCKCRPRATRRSVGSERGGLADTDRCQAGTKRSRQAHLYSHRTKSVQELFFLEEKTQAQRTEEPIPRFGDVLSGLETDHLWVVWG